MKTVVERSQFGKNLDGPNMDGKGRLSSGGL
jgi:hypothetical protein